jgi:hypothetical protein
MTMATQTLEALGDRVERLAEAITAQNRTLAMMLSNQRLHNEMLAKMLEAVGTPPGDDALGGMLSEIVKQVGEIRERVYLE